MDAGPDYNIKNNDQGVVVFILTDRQRKERKPDTKNSSSDKCDIEATGANKPLE